MQFLDIRGVSMPALGLGTYKLEGAEGVRSMQKALEIGYRHIDTAQIYGNEEEVGKAIKQSKIPRDELFITTKLWTNNFTASRVQSSAEQSLTDLKMEYVDLLLMHWPNPEVSLSETLDAMQKLMQQGKTKAIGVSNFPVSLMKEAVENCKAPIVCNQVEYHVMLSQKPVIDYAREHNIVVTAYSPLGQGTLASETLLKDIGNKYGKTAGQVALRWLIEQKGVAAIPKAASEKNARTNFDIFDFSLSSEDKQAIDALGKNNRLVNPGFAPQWDAA